MKQTVSIASTKSPSKLQAQKRWCSSLLIALCLVFALPSHAITRIKDIVSVEGVRDNLLVGYGLVVGLNGTGDNLSNAVFTQKGLTDFLERLGISTRGATLKTKNIAAVTVTAVLPPFSRQGSRIDITVSTLGDAKSLQDGTLLATPLVGADGQVYAVAQGSISTSGFTAQTTASGPGQAQSSISKNVTTNATVVGGAIIEREIDFDLANMPTINFALHNPDLTTAINLANSINVLMGYGYAKARDPGTVQLTIPEYHRDRMVEVLSRIEQLEVKTDQPAKIVIDEASGTIVMGDNVSISPIAIAQGNLTVSITEDPIISQPGAFSPNASTIIAKESKIKIDAQPNNHLAVLQTGVTLGDLVAGLNALGVGPRDLITILHTIKTAGALQASIEMR